MAGTRPVGRASGPLGAVQAADREIARQTAVRARAVAAFAATRPASADRPAGQPGCMSEERRAARPAVLADVSEWAAQELVVALSISSAAAEALLTRSLTLVHRLPRTLAALESGLLHPGHLWPMLDKVAPIADGKVRAEVEAQLLTWATGRVTTPAQLGDKARRVVLARDARAAAGRLTTALRDRGVWARPDATDGMALLSAFLTVPEAHALVDALGRYADALDDPDDERTRGQKMADCLLDLVLRPGENDIAPVQAQLTLVASVSTMAGGDEPGEIGGEPVPAEMVRALALALGLLPAPAVPRPDEDQAAGQPSAEDRVPARGNDSAEETPSLVRHAHPGDAAPDEGDRGATVDDFCPTTESQGSAAEQRALELWWAEVEERVLREEWGGEEDPPPEELLRWWEREAWLQHLPAASDLWDPREHPDRSPTAVVPPAPDPAPDAHADSGSAVEPGTWAAVDQAIDTAGAVLLDLHRAVGRARDAVQRAEAADAADEQVWLKFPEMAAADDAITALAHVGDEQRAALAALLDAPAGGCLVDRPRIAVRDALTGALLALTDSTELRTNAHCGSRRCRRAPETCTHDLGNRPGLGPPPPTDGYRPGARLDRFLRARDRRCRFPGCRAPVPRGGELDHDRRYPDGPTSAANLAGYCTPHHRGKHQAPGWQHELAADGALTVTSPTGLVAVTTPPPY